MKRLLACMAVTGLTTLGVLAQEQPFQASLTPDIAVYPQTTEIAGLTLSIWGENPQHALAIGFVNGTASESGGLSLGLVNYGDDYKGVQWGVANYTRGDFLGWQNGVVNYTGGRFTGFQSGWINYADTLSGVQFGLLNIAEKTDDGVQVGIVNILRENTVWFTDFPKSVAPGMIFVNWCF